jgi:PhnB protein
MQVELFINFDGNCREAVEFYARVFHSEVHDLMTYGQAPPDPNHAASEEDKDKICYAGIPIGGMVLMFMDMPSGFPLEVGNNISPTISTDDKNEVTRLVNALKEDGKVHMEPQKTFFSEWYGMVEDKYGVIWHISYSS